MKQVGQNTVLFNAANNMIDYEELEHALINGGGLEAVAKRLGISKYKTYGSMDYFIVDTTEGLYLVMFEGDSYYPSATPVRFSDSTNKDYLYTSVTDLTLKEIMEIDPMGQYYTRDKMNWSQANAFSYHFYDDGTVFVIIYDDKDNAIRIAEFTI